MKNMVEKNVLDLLLAKQQAIKLATDAAVTVLRVDQVRAWQLVHLRDSDLFVFAADNSGESGRWTQAAWQGWWLG